MFAQPAILAEAVRHHHFLELDLSSTATDDELRAVRSAAPDGASTLLAFRDSLWKRLHSAAGPDSIGDFAGIEGANGRRAVATQQDLMVWIRGAARDEVFARTLQVGELLAPCTRLAYDESGFVHLDSRDLTGFIDGTANPKDEKAPAAAFVPEGAPGAGGSHVLLQRWVHDLGAFSKLPVDDQQRVIGRTKPDSIELEGDAMPVDSHVSRTDVSSAKILRRSVPFGDLRENGLQFLAFAADRARHQLLLERMYGLTEDGLADRLLHFSKAVRGAFYFAPSVEELGTALG